MLPCDEEREREREIHTLCDFRSRKKCLRISDNAHARYESCNISFFLTTFRDLSIDAGKYIRPILEKEKDLFTSSPVIFIVEHRETNDERKTRSRGRILGTCT